MVCVWAWGCVCGCVYFIGCGGILLQHVLYYSECLLLVVYYITVYFSVSITESITVYYCVLLCITLYPCVLLCITLYPCVLLFIPVFLLSLVYLLSV